MVVNKADCILFGINNITCRRCSKYINILGLTPGFQCTGQRQLLDETRNISVFRIWCDLYEQLDGNYGPLYDYHYEKSWVTFVEISSNAVCIVLLDFIKTLFMITSSNGNIFLAAALCEGNPMVIGHRLIRLTKSSDAELWWFVWSTPDQTFEQIIEAPVMWDAIPRIMTSL